MKTDETGDAGRDRWNLWKLQALFPDATPAFLAGLRGRAAEIADLEEAVLRRGEGDLEALVREARAFIDTRPELQSGLIPTMHMGPYALLPAIFLMSGITPAVVLDRAALDRIRPTADAQRRRLALDGNVEWIATDGDTFVTRMLRALRNGRPVLVYLDGNRGAGGMEATRDHGLPFGLPGRTIRLRTGLGRLIDRIGCPVHCVNVRWKRDGRLEWRAVDIGPLEAETGAVEITRRLYDWLFGEVLETPEQWSFWEMLGEASDCFARDRLGDPDRERLRDRSAAFTRALETGAATTRVALKKTVEVWEGDLLVDLAGQNFYSAEGMSDASLDLLRWGREPTLQAMIADCGERWVRRHLLRLHLLDLLDLKVSS